MLKISVIIPVYNCEKYIVGCLNSVFRQTLTDIEIICIDDGSTDYSYEMILDCQQADPRVRVLQQKNMGAGVARNYGLSIARGEYVIFLDADDYYLEQNALEVMYEYCVNNRICICGSPITLLKDGKLVEDSTFYEIKEIAKGEKILHYFDYQFDYFYQGFLFQRKLLVENCVKFPPYKRFEDPPFFVKAMYFANQFGFAQCRLYCYRAPEMSTRYNEEKVIDLLKGIRDNLLFAKEHSLQRLFHTMCGRLEYEYFSVICRNIKPENEIAMNLLRSLNELIICSCEREVKKIRPLQFLENNAGDIFEHYGESLVKRVNELNSIYVYGAGGLARNLIHFFGAESLLHKVEKVIVSSKKNNDTSIQGIEIVELDGDRVKKDIPIFVAVGAVFQYEIVEHLNQLGYSNYVIVDCVFMESPAAVDVQNEDSK